MNKERIDRWIEALKSGKYIQGLTPDLRYSKYYSPLGVACAVSGIGYWNTNPKSDNKEDYIYVTPSGSNQFTLPIEVIEFYRLTDVDLLSFFLGEFDQEQNRYIMPSHFEVATKLEDLIANL